MVLAFPSVRDGPGANNCIGVSTVQNLSLAVPSIALIWHNNLSLTEFPEANPAAGG
jgi:hypothetical protein